MVDAVHVACAGADQFRDRQPGTEADLKDLVGELHTEQRNHPAAALPVGRVGRGNGQLRATVIGRDVPDHTG